VRYKDRAVVSISAMLTALKTQVKDGQTVWFRGHGLSTWELVPSLARNPAHLLAENAVTKRFMQNATPHLKAAIMREWEWMFLMQHHRAPTRLLDWTESPLTAMYFAVSEALHTGNVAAVWCLDPVALNREANLSFDFEQEIPAFGNDKNLESYLPSRVKDDPTKLQPIAIMGPRNTPRMAAQLGTFTINHRLHTPIEQIGKQKHVWRWLVPPTAKSNVMRELSILGVSALTVFPELDRVADLSKELLP